MAKFAPGNQAAVGRKPQSTLTKKLREQVGPEWDAIVSAVILAAKGGDMRAVEILATRVAPPEKAVGPCIRLDIPPEIDHAERARRIVQAVVDGHLPPDQGKVVMDLISQSVQLTELQEMEQRIAQLEQRRA